MDPVLHFEFHSSLAPLVLREEVPVDLAGVSTCALCGSPLAEGTRDHVFPQFLGGKRRVRACKPCNDRCGHTFEAAANESVFVPLYVYLASTGLRTARDGVEWRNALVRDGTAYHLVGRDGEAVERLANPVVRRATDGTVESVRCADMKAAKPFLREARRRGQEYTIVPDKREQKDAPGLRLVFDFGPAVQRLALKLGLAAASLLPDISVDEVAGAQQELLGPANDPTSRSRVSPVGYADVAAACGPLHHAVFVERAGEHVYAVVQFFGCVQFYCALGERSSTKRAAAILATLDPLTGTEAFRFASPLRLPVEFRIPDARTAALAAASSGRWWGDQFRAQIVARGGRDIPLPLEGKAGREE